MAPRHVSRALFVLAIRAIGCHEIDRPDPSTGASSRSPSAAAALEVGRIHAESSTSARSHEGFAAVAVPRGTAVGGSTVSERLRIWSDPRSTSGGTTSIAVTNPWGQRITFPVRRQLTTRSGTWYKIQLGVEPNGSTGWVDARDVVLRRLDERIVIDLSERRLRHYDGSELRHSFSVGIGAPATPTTTGRFFVWAHLDPSGTKGPYGSYLLGLSGFSEVLTSWPGGGRMAIHGTDDPTDAGRRVSFGCPRVFNRQMNELRDVPMGTSVLIRP